MSLTDSRHAIDPAAHAFRDRASAFGLRFNRTLTVGPITLNLDRYRLTVADRAVELSPLQLELLAVFLAAPDRVWSRPQLNLLTGGGDDASRRIDVRLARLRQALGSDLFRAIPGRGWMLRPHDEGNLDT